MHSPSTNFLAFLLVLNLVIAIGCGPSSSETTTTTQSNTASSKPKQTLLEARKNFFTKIIRTGDDAGPSDVPTGNEFQLIKYQSPVGKLAAYVTKDPKDGKKHPAIVWVTGGDNNSIGNVWDTNPRSNDQGASAFRKAGIVMMFPSQRGGNDNPGKREGFYGEVFDVLAATDHLEKLPYVDSEQIYLGGHSTGGTLVMLVAACTKRYKAVFSLGPVAAPEQYGGSFVYCDINNKQEIALRSPIYWLHSVKSPMYVFEGEQQGNWEAIQIMIDANKNSNIHFYKVPNQTHFTVIAPLAEMLAKQIVDGKITVTDQMINNLK